MKTKQDISAHFRRRCIERLGMAISQKRLVCLMKENKLEHVRRQSLSKTIWRIPKEELERIGIETEQKVIVVYDKIRHGFVTVMISG